MILIDQLRISDDGKYMYINAHVNGADYFTNIFIDKITIMTADKVSETHPEIPTEDYIYTETFDGNQKSINLVLTALDFTRVWETDPSAIAFKQSDMSKTLFFVYIKCKGVPSNDTPCGLDNMTTVGVTFDEKVLYQKAMSYTKDMLSDCNVPLGFTDFILLWNAFKAAVNTRHFISAIKFFNLLFNTIGSYTGITNRGCGCHG